MIDDRFIDELKAGSSQAFKQLVEDHKHKVINICYRFVNNREEAEDLAQETFITVFRFISKFRGDSSVSTWIHRIAVSKSLDHCRKRNRQKRKGLFGKTIRLDGSLVDIPASSSSKPDVITEVSERRQVLQSALASIPRNQRTAFVLSKYDGLSYEEIASTMKTSASAVTSLIHRAKKNLQKRLGKYYESRL